MQCPNSARSHPPTSPPFPLTHFCDLTAFQAGRFAETGAGSAASIIARQDAFRERMHARFPLTVSVHLRVLITHIWKSTMTAGTVSHPGGDVSRPPAHFEL